MHIKIENKKIEIKVLTKKIDRFKSLKFVLEPIKYGIKIPNKKIINTYYFCQRVDICITDKNNKIIKKYENFKSEKIRFILKSHNIYYLPLNSSKHLNINDILIEQ